MPRGRADNWGLRGWGPGLAAIAPDGVGSELSSGGEAEESPPPPPEPEAGWPEPDPPVGEENPPPPEGPDLLGAPPAVEVAVYVWVTQQDARVCPTCGPLDGTRWEGDDGPFPPLHVGCRCERRLLAVERRTLRHDFGLWGVERGVWSDLREG